jgi:deoxycytidine triphosphate deaminase
MVLGNKEICSIRRMEPSLLSIEPFHEEQVGPASYDLRLGDDFIGPGGRNG